MANKYIGVWVMNMGTDPIAYFSNMEEAEVWGRAIYPYKWLTREVELPLTPYMTEEEYQLAKEQSEKYLKFFKVDDDV